jgi:hypothetical protein
MIVSNLIKRGACKALSTPPTLKEIQEALASLPGDGSALFRCSFLTATRPRISVPKPRRYNYCVLPGALTCWLPKLEHGYDKSIVGSKKWLEPPDSNLAVQTLANCTGFHTVYDLSKVRL